MVSEIARVVEELRGGQFRWGSKPPTPFTVDEAVGVMAAAAQTATLVDVTAIHRDVIARTSGTMLYEDHPCIAPPWDTALICFENTFGNVWAMLAMTYPSTRFPDLDEIPRWEDDKGIDWDNDVRWVLDTKVFSGGRNGDGVRLPTMGPLVQYRWAIGHEGQPLDLHWQITHRDITDISMMDIPQLVLLESLKFMACRNVELIEPARRNHERKRLARKGLRINELHVFPSGKSSRSKGAKGQPLGSVHAPVRGHFASYGPAYGRGLLFGKYEGRFFIPPHVRGSKDVGESVQEFTLRTDSAQA